MFILHVTTTWYQICCATERSSTCHWDLLFLNKPFKALFLAYSATPCEAYVWAPLLTKYASVTIDFPPILIHSAMENPLTQCSKLPRHLRYKKPWIHHAVISLIRHIYLYLYTYNIYNIYIHVFHGIALQWRHLNVMMSQITGYWIEVLLNSLYGPTSKKNHWPFVEKIHRLPVNSLHKGPLTRKMLPCDDVTIDFGNTLTLNTFLINDEAQCTCMKNALIFYDQFCRHIFWET